MSYIPGLSYIPVEDPEAGISIHSFANRPQGFIPESRVYGNCQPVTDFEKLGTIYEGEYGKVYKCWDKRTNELYALKKFKMFSMENGIPNRILRETKHLKSLKHENIVTYVRAVAGKGLDSNYMLLEYCEYSLNDFLEKNMTGIYEIDSVKYVMKQLFEGLAYIHDGMVLHRNITCSNILFNEKGILKIAGFRTSRVHSKTGDMTPEVTELIYRAPELLLGAKKYGPAVDMWSAGCVFARLLLRKPLITGNSELEVFNCICYILGTPSEASWPGFQEYPIRLGGDDKPFSTIKKLFCDVPKLSFEIISNLIVYYPMDRLSSKICLRSPFFQEPPEVCSPETFLQNLSLGASMEVER